MLNQVGTNPNVRIKVGTDFNVHVQVGTNPNVHIQVGTEPIVRIQVDTKSNAYQSRHKSKWRIQVGTEPNAYPSRHIFDCVDRGRQTISNILIQIGTNSNQLMKVH